jgi:hypothetical protein
MRRRHPCAFAHPRSFQRGLDQPVTFRRGRSAGAGLLWGAARRFGPCRELTPGRRHGPDETASSLDTMGYLTLFPPPPVPGTPPAESKRVRPVPRQDGPAYCPPRSPDRVRACDWPSAESRLSSARGLGCCSWQSHGSAGRAERRRPADGHGRGIAPTFRKERQQWINEWTDGSPRSLRQRR